MGELFTNLSLFDLVFAGIAGITLLCALAMIMFNNIVHSVVAMIGCFLGIAGLYFTMEAGFLALVQIIVYAGAISVIIIFAFMILMDREPAVSNVRSPRYASIFFGSVLAGFVSLALLIAVILSDFPIVGDMAANSDQVGTIAGLMLGNYVIPFEAAAILLLVAVVGAILLARGERAQ